MGLSSIKKKINHFVDKGTSAVGDLYGSAQEDPLGVASTVAGHVVGTSYLTAGLQAGTRMRDDQRDQKISEAEQEQAAATAAEARADDASVKPVDAMSIERRRRASLASGRGRSGTILTGGSLGNLGSGAGVYKTLLGM